MGWNYLSIPKLERLLRRNLGKNKWFHPKLYWACGYFSMLGKNQPMLVKGAPGSLEDTDPFIIHLVSSMFHVCLWYRGISSQGSTNYGIELVLSIYFGLSRRGFTLCIYSYLFVHKNRMRWKEREHCKLHQEPCVTFTRENAGMFSCKLLDILLSHRRQHTGERKQIQRILETKYWMRLH